MIALTTALPPTLDPREVDRVVKNFCQESVKRQQFTSDCSLEGLYQQTVDNIAQIIVYKPNGRYLWLDTDGKRVLAYVLTHVSKDVDNSYCYYMTQAYLDPSLRHTSYAKEAVQKLREHAKQLMCRHIVVASSRGSRGYCRFLGKNWKPYVTLLKEDI